MPPTSITWSHSKRALKDVTLCLRVTVVVITWLILTPPVLADFLQGSVKHEDRLEPLGAQFRPGTAFPYQPADTEVDTEQWFVIPNWLAGKWTCVEALQTYLFNFQTHSEDASSLPLRPQQHELLGLQKDKNGEIWTRESTSDTEPYAQPMTTPAAKGVTDDEGRVVTLRKNAPLGSTEDGIHLKTTDTTLIIKKATQKIATSTKMISYRTIHRLSDDLIAIYQDGQTYDEQGFPLTRQRKVGLFRRQEGFIPVDHTGTVDLRASFYFFLRHSGRVGLIPAS